MVPNRKIVGEILHNYGKIRQLELSVSVAYGSDLPAVMAVLSEILSQNPLVLKSPSPGLGISALTDSSIKIAILPWTAVPDAGPAGAQIYSAIITRFKAKGIEIPIPKQEIRMIGGN
jgi:small conductance mechanosensitive channel